MIYIFNTLQFNPRAMYFIATITSEYEFGFGHAGVGRSLPLLRGKLAPPGF